MRLFIALDLPDHVTESIERWREPFIKKYSELKWAGRHSLHVTLRFLGNVDPGPVLAEMKRMNLKQYLPAEFTLDRSGTFGRPPSVLWLSGKFSPGALRMAETLSKIPDEQGLSETRRFHPHITVARSRRGDSVPLLPMNEKLKGNCLSVSLFTSTLTREGPVYSLVYSEGH